MVKALPTLGHAVVDWWAHGLAIIKDLAKHPERDPALAALIQQAVAVCGGPPSPLLDTTGHTLQLELSWGADGAWWITGISPMNKGPFLLQCWLLQLPALQAQWEKHGIMVRWMQRFFQYLDRFYVEINSLTPLAL
jgi:hypothetical protein